MANLGMLPEDIDRFRNNPLGTFPHLYCCRKLRCPYNLQHVNSFMSRYTLKFFNCFNSRQFFLPNSGKFSSIVFTTYFDKLGIHRRTSPQLPHIPNLILNIVTHPSQKSVENRFPFLHTFQSIHFQYTPLSQSQFAYCHFIKSQSWVHKLLPMGPKH